MPGSATTADAVRATGRRIRAAWRAPLWAHAVALAVVVAVALVVVGDEGVFSSDEGAGLAQMESVADGQWGMAHPLPEVDPTGAWFPLEKARTLPDGTFAPLPKKGSCDRSVGG